MSDNPLQEYFDNNKGKLIHKWLHYFDIYHRHFQPYRKKPVTILEFGVFQGGSLQMWRHYFGKKARIIGVDINPKCKELEEKGIEIYIGDQEDRKFLKKLMKKVGKVDVVIEDGGHTMNQQINTFEEVYPYVKDGGVFLIEDLHTSYWNEYGGGYRKPGTFIEYAKAHLDYLNAWHSRDSESFKVNQFTETVKGMHVYDSIIVFDKGQVTKPFHKMTGHETVGY
jgi:SAM-dependent methyltransferase